MAYQIEGDRAASVSDKLLEVLEADLLFEPVEDLRLLDLLFESAVLLVAAAVRLLKLN